MTDLVPKKTLHEDIKDSLDGFGCPEPHVFMAQIMAGVDPRHAPGTLYSLVKLAADNETETGAPHQNTWERIKEFVLDNPIFRGEFISLNESCTMAKELMGYLHPKRKAVEITGELNHLVQVVPLTDEDIERLEEKMRGEF